MICISVYKLRKINTSLRGVYFCSKFNIANAKITVYKRNSQLVHSAILNIANTKRSLNLTTLKLGTYLVNVLKGAQQISHKIIVN